MEQNTSNICSNDLKKEVSTIQYQKANSLSGDFVSKYDKTDTIAKQDKIKDSMIQSTIILQSFSRGAILRKQFK